MTSIGLLLLVIGIVIGAFALMFMPSRGKSSGIMFGGVVAVIGLFLFVAPNLAGTPEDQSLLGGKSYNITWTEEQSHVTSDLDAKTFTMAVSYDSATGKFMSGTGWLNATFTIDRTDGLDEDASVSGQLLNVPGIAPSLGSDREPLLLEQDNGKYYFKWDRAGVSFDQNVNVKVEAFGSSQVNLTLQLNPEAFEGQDLYDTNDITFKLAGSNFVIHVIYAVDP